MNYDKEWYLSVLNAINDMILVKGDKSKLLWANKAFCDYYNMSNEQLQNIIDSEHSDPDDTIQYVKDDHYVFSKGITLDVPSEAVTDGEGNENYFHTIKNPIKNKDGITERTVGVSRLIEDDELIAHSKKLRKEQKTSIRNLRAFVNTIPSPVIMLDLTKRIITYSDSWIKNFPSKEELFGENFSDHYKKLFIQSELDEVIKNKIRCTIDVVSFKFDGLQKYFKVHIDPWAMSSGEIGGVLILLNDITSEIEKEKALKAHNEELKQFAYITTHDVKSPIANIESFLEFLKEDKTITDITSLNAIHWISKSIEKANTKIDDLVKVIEQREASIFKETISLPSFIDDIKGSVNVDELSLKDFLDVEIIGSTSIVSSKKQLNTIFENLLTNGLRYRKNNKNLKIKLTVDTTSSAENSITISDNGVGINLDLHGERIFEMFKRANDVVEGNGLGLYLVKQACGQLRGNVKVKSQLNQGTTFIVYLPKN